MKIKDGYIYIDISDIPWRIHLNGDYDCGEGTEWKRWGSLTDYIPSDDPEFFNAWDVLKRKHKLERYYGRV